MKKLFLLSCVMFSFVFLGAQSIDFDSKVMDYGTIAHNSDGLREFKFVNNGTKPLVIKNAKGSCGCTVPSYKKKDGSSEWAPGESGTIQVKYATNRIGKFTKTITLSTNTPDNRPVILTIKGEVLSPEKDSGLPTKNTKGSPLEGK
jgi:hypothetical protein